LWNWIEDYADRARSQPDIRPNPARLATVHRFEQQLNVWRLLESRAKALVDFDDLLRQVLDSESIRLDAANVNHRLDVLSQQIREHQPSILDQARSEIDALAQARDRVVDVVAAPPAAPSIPQAGQHPPNLPGAAEMPRSGSREGALSAL